MAPALAGSAFYHPTLLEVTDPSLPIVQKEIVGLVQTLQLFDNEDQAVALANDSEYGLSACIWSRDIDRPMRVARRLEAGLISLSQLQGLTNGYDEVGLRHGALRRRELSREADRPGAGARPHPANPAAAPRPSGAVMTTSGMVRRRCSPRLASSLGPSSPSAWRGTARLSSGAPSTWSRRTSRPISTCTS